MKQKDEDNGVCKVCNGEGRVRIEEEIHGEVEVTQQFCEACGGTGLEPGDGDVD